MKYLAVTPNNTLFGLSFGYDVYTKLINLGMVYINWNATTNSYRVSKNYEAPLITGSCYCNFSKVGSTSLGKCDYPTGNWGRSSVTFTSIKMYTNSYIGAYGADGSTSGKYDIKTNYDRYVGFGTNQCDFRFFVSIDTWSAGDGFGGTYGKSWFKAFNCWFSKS